MLVTRVLFVVCLWLGSVAVLYARGIQLNLAAALAVQLDLQGCGSLGCRSCCVSGSRRW